MFPGGCISNGKKSLMGWKLNQRQSKAGHQTAHPVQSRIAGATRRRHANAEGSGEINPKSKPNKIRKHLI